MLAIMALIFLWIWSLSSSDALSCCEQGIMLVYDITNERSFENIKNWIRNIEEVQHRVVRAYIFIYILICCWICKVIFITRTWLRYVRVFAIAISSVCRLSSACNVGAPYSGGRSFRQNFFTAVYAGHPLTSMQNFTEIVLGEPLRRER